jgi:hypothetical protein
VDRALVRFNASAQKDPGSAWHPVRVEGGFDPKGFIMFSRLDCQRERYSKMDSFFLTKPSLDERLLERSPKIQYLPPKSGIHRRHGRIPESKQTPAMILKTASRNCFVKTLSKQFSLQT